MVSDPYLFSENASRNRERIVQARRKRRRAGTRHFRTAINISSFDRNATPAGPDDESGQLHARLQINPDISMVCLAQSLLSSSRTLSTTKITPREPIPQ